MLLPLSMALPLILASVPACVIVDLGEGETSESQGETSTGTSATGDGDGDASSSGDGDGDSGDGDGDSGDGDGDTTTNGDGDGDTSGDGDGDELIPCEIPEIDLEPVVPHVMLVLDKSGSMISNSWDHDNNNNTADVTRWNSLVSVVDLIVNQFGDQFEFGAQL